MAYSTMIVACSSPFKLPPRLARQRRLAESRRMDTFREFHENLKKTAKDEIELIREIVRKKDDVDPEVLEPLEN